MPDTELLTALKMAKSKKMFFAFIPKGGSDGHLIVSKVKIPPKRIAEAKKEHGGGAPVTGKCIGGDNGAMLFQVAKAAPPALAAAVKKVAKRDTGLSIDPEFQLAGDADAEEQDTGAAAGAAEVEAKVTPKPLLDPQLTFPQLDGASKDPANMPIDFGAWQIARQKAITDLKALAAKVASTKHGRSVGVLKELNSVIKRLPAKPAPHEIEKLEDFIRNDEAITAAENVPAHFHDLDIREQLLKALEQMRK